MNKLSVVAGLAFALLPLSQAQAAGNGFLKLTGPKASALKNAVGAGHKHDAILVHGVELDLHSQRDLATGQSMGKNGGGTVAVVKPVDDVTAGLLKAFEDNDNFTSVEIELWAPSEKGVEANYLTIKLTNAKLTRLRLVKPWAGASDAKAGDYEELTFAFRKVEYTHPKPGSASAP